MPTLVLMRHAKSAWPAGVEDELRPLNERGRRDAPAAGRLLAGRPILDAAIVSPATRTQETFALVAAELPEPPPMRSDGRIYEAGVDDLLDAIAQAPSDAARLLVVGHNPGMESLARWLCKPSASPAYRAMVAKYPTAAIAEIAIPRVWGAIRTGQGSAHLTSFDIPRG